MFILAHFLNYDSDENDFIFIFIFVAQNSIFNRRFQI